MFHKSHKNICIIDSVAVGRNDANAKANGICAITTKDIPSTEIEERLLALENAH